jgi:hypothetical protein
MAFVTADRVRDTSTTAGSGSFSVSGTAPTGYRTFSAVLSVSDTFYYSIQHQTLNEWEVGLGTYSSANTFARTTIYSSSNAGSAVTFSAGTKDVFITMAAARSLQLDASGNVTPSINGTLSWQSVQTGNFTAVAGNAYPVNTTSGAVTVTLPASPSAGQAVLLTDYASTWATNNVTLSPNGGKITGATNNSILNVSGSSLSFVYIDSTQGWIPYSAFKTLSSGQIVASYLIAAGGGGGGGGQANISVGSGGGAGGLLTGTLSLVKGTTYTATVGAGGTAGSFVAGGAGNNSTLTGVATTAVGGGGGVTGSGVFNGVSGGSGSGAAYTGSAGAGTSGQGYAGGTGAINPNYGSGGGGGAGGVGGNGTTSVGGNGGSGAFSSITGTSVGYAGGGAGGIGFTGSGGTATSGGGAGSVAPTAATAGTANTGGGGGGAGGNGAALAGVGGAGGSGVIILSILTSDYSGTTTGSPTITVSGINTIIKFTASGSYTA